MDNVLPISASAYQGIAVIHLPKRPLRALGCGPEAIVLVEQNSSSSLPIWLDTKQLDFASIVPKLGTPNESELSLACSLGLHIGSQPYSGRRASASQNSSHFKIYVCWQCNALLPLREAIKSKLLSALRTY